MMKFGTPDTDDGPGSASMKVGFERVGEPSRLRSFGRLPAGWRRGSLSAFLSTREGICLDPLSSGSMKRPLPVRSWGAPPSERGACSGFSAGVVSAGVVSAGAAA